MRCPRCNSLRLINFIDGFGNKRIFCKDCFLSVDAEVFKKLVSQTTLFDFDLDKYMRLGKWTRLQL